MKIKALIIDDEPLARNVILQYSKKIDYLEIICSCEDAVQALDFINNSAIDLLFLDINMPTISGISFLKTLKNPPLVIFTTAYSDYALEGYELNIIDYLKKPFPFERFLLAVQKASELIKLKRQANKEPLQTNDDDYIFIKADKKTFKISLKDILFVEGLGDYIKIHLKNQKIVANLTMKKIQDILPQNDFYRIHKSFIISLQKIEIIEGNMVVINQNKIPIGNNFRQEFFDMINKKLPT
jgi:DNA-binding LytR/AlgR family response regulator